MSLITEQDNYRFTDDLLRVTETPWHISEGSRGGYAFRGETKDSNSEVAYIWPLNAASEMELMEYVHYVGACIEELVDAYWLDAWKLRGKPKGPIG